MVLTCNCIAGHWAVGLRFYSTHKLIEPGEISDCFLCSCPWRPMQFFTSNSLAAHLGGGRGCQGGVPVTEGPKVSGFQGFGEGNPKLLDTVTGESLTASPGAIPSPLRELFVNYPVFYPQILLQTLFVQTLFLTVPCPERSAQPQQSEEG